MASSQSPGRRQFARYNVAVPLTAIAFRPEGAVRLSGRSRDIGHGGIRAIFGDSLREGERMELEFALPPVRNALRFPVIVRYQDELNYGFEFLSLKRSQRHALETLDNAAGSGYLVVINSAEQDGARVPTPGTGTVVCPSCGSQYPDDKFFCFNCGAPSQSPPPEPPAAPKRETEGRVLPPWTWAPTGIRTRFSAASWQRGATADSVIAILFLMTLAIGLFQWLNTPSSASTSRVDIQFSDLLLRVDPLPTAKEAKRAEAVVTASEKQPPPRRSSSSANLRGFFDFSADVPIGQPGSASAQARRPAPVQTGSFSFSTAQSASPSQPSPPSKWTTSNAAAQRPEQAQAMPAAPPAAAPSPATAGSPANRQDHWTGAGLQILERVMPRYPTIAQSEHVQGEVVLAATISRDGTIADVRPVSGPAVLTSSAVEAVRQWRFRPYQVDGRPIEVQTNIRLNFALAR